MERRNDPTPTAKLPTEPPPRWPVRVGLAVTTLVYLVYSSFGIAAPFWWGHHGYHGATYMLRARTSLRWHMLAPATFTGFDFPTKDAYYFHHPIGYHHILTLLMPIFGDHEWLARGVAVAGGLTTLWALYALVRRMWSREAGLVAVIIYTFLPVLISFSVLSDPMLLEMSCVLWGLNKYFELLERPSWRALWSAAAAYFIGGLLMWEVFFIGPFIAVHALAYSLGRRGSSLRIGRWNAPRLHIWFIGIACCAAMGFHIWFTWRTGLWQDFLDSYRIRHAPPSAQYVIDRHTQWVDILYGRPPVVLGAVWFLVWLGRVALGRARLRDLAPLTFLYVNTLYIYMFAEGSSVHLYRVFFYSSFFTLAVTDLVDDAYRAGRRLWPRVAWSGLAVGLALLAGYLGTELPHSYHNWIESRVLMGTHGETHYDPEEDKMLFAQEVNRRTRPDERLIIDFSELGARKEFWYYLDRSFDNITNLRELDGFKKNWKKSVLLVDEQMLSGWERQKFEELMQHHPVTFYDHFTMVDLRSDKPLVSSYGFAPGKMSLGYRWWISHKYPPLHLTRVGYLPGICTALELGVPVARDEQAPPAPRDARLLACYRNYLVTLGETAKAKQTGERLLRGLHPVSLALGQARVVAVGRVGRMLHLAIEASGPEKGELRVVADESGREQELAVHPAVPPSRWQAGFLYIEEVPFTVGALRLQLVTAAPPLPSLPPGRFTPRHAHAITPPPIVRAQADLGRF